MKKQTKISIRIIIMACIIFVASFLPELYPKLFGDWLCNGSSEFHNGIGLKCSESLRPHGPDWHYGYRHWVFIFTGLVLSVVQVVFLIESIDEK